MNIKSVLSLTILAFTVAPFSLLSAAQQPQPKAEVEIAQPNQEGHRRDGIAIANLEVPVNTTKDRAFIVAPIFVGITECVSNS